MYVIAPTSFTFFGLVYIRNSSDRVIVIVVVILLPCVEVSGAVAFLLGIVNGNLSPALGAGYIVSFLGAIWLLYSVVVGLLSQCCCASASASAGIISSRASVSTDNFDCAVQVYVPEPQTSIWRRVSAFSIDEAY